MEFILINYFNIFATLLNNTEQGFNLRTTLETKQYFFINNKIQLSLNWD